jgi:hypothetical protein
VTPTETPALTPAQTPTDTPVVEQAAPPTATPAPAQARAPPIEPLTQLPQAPTGTPTPTATPAAGPEPVASEPPCAGARAAAELCEPAPRPARAPAADPSADPGVNPLNVRPDPDPEQVRITQAALDQAVANVESAQARVDRLAADPGADQVELDFARKQLQEAKAERSNRQVAADAAAHPLTTNEQLDNLQVQLGIGSFVPVAGPIFAGTDLFVTGARTSADIYYGDSDRYLADGINVAVPVAGTIFGRLITGAGKGAAAVVDDAVETVADEAAVAGRLGDEVVPDVPARVKTVPPGPAQLADEVVEDALDEPEAYAFVVDHAGGVVSPFNDEAELGAYVAGGGKPVSTRTLSELPEEVPPGFRRDGTLPRRTTATAHCQIGPTCHDTAATDILNDMGIDVTPEQFTREVDALRVEGRPGTTDDQVKTVMAKFGVESEIYSDVDLNRIIAETKDGPVLAVRDSAAVKPNSTHAFVVDGVTVVEGELVVAIRDPSGGTYFQLAQEFMKTFEGTIIVPAR